MPPGSYQLDNSGTHEESDLSLAVKRLQKVIETLMPPEARDPYLNAVQSALLVTNAERDVEAA